MISSRELSIKVEALQNLLVSYSTGGVPDEAGYTQLRLELLAEPALQGQLPRFLRTCRSMQQFWPFIQGISPTYRGRREYLWSQFGPILDALELADRTSSPSDEIISDTLARVDSQTIHLAWRRAIQRRFEDPDGAITAARTLLETVCKHILDRAGTTYGSSPTLPELYRLTSQILNLAPGRQTEAELRRIFGSISNIVEAIGTMRNILGDAHGSGADSERPLSYHAELAVNLAGTLATFLIDVWESQQL